jgi:hypothetical protein
LKAHPFCIPDRPACHRTLTRKSLILTPPVPDAAADGAPDTNMPDLCERLAHDSTFLSIVSQSLLFGTLLSLETVEIENLVTRTFRRVRTCQPRIDN